MSLTYCENCQLTEGDTRYSATRAALDAYRQAARDVVSDLGLLNVKVGDTGDTTGQDPRYFVND